MNALDNIFKPLSLLKSSIQMVTASSIASRLELPETIVRELFTKFIHNASIILTQLQEHPTDPVRLKMAIHSLKGISQNLFLETVAEKCEQFEKELGLLSDESKRKRLEEIAIDINAILQKMQKEFQ